ncbi:MAG: metallophosphoesterase family protein [Bacteroidota bacterium]
MKLRLVILLTITTVSILSCHNMPEEVSGLSAMRLVWNDDPSTTMSIIWDGMESEEVVLYYDTIDHDRKYWKYAHQQSPYRKHDFYGMNTRYVKLEDLQPDKAYYFVVKDSAGLSARYWFRTAPDQPQPFTFIAGGDTKSDGDVLEAGRASNRLVAKLRPLFVLFNGDFTSGNGTDPDNWKQWLTDWCKMTTTRDGRMIPVVPVHGNHEDGNKGNLNIIFDAPYQSNDSSNIYFSLSFGGDLFHLIALNSQIEEGGAQKEWLEKDLKNHEPFTFKVAAYHKPFWPHTSRKGENAYQYRQWAFLFHKYGLNISLDADSHMHKITYPVKPDTISQDSFMGYVRDDRIGTMFIGEGSWGAHPRQNDDDKPWTMASGSFNQVKWMHVFPQDEKEGAHINIYTVITAGYDENAQLQLFNEEVEPLSEDNRFTVPAGLKLFNNEEGRDFVAYPYNGN